MTVIALGDNGKAIMNQLFPPEGDTHFLAKVVQPLSGILSSRLFQEVLQEGAGLAQEGLDFPDKWQFRRFKWYFRRGTFHKETKIAWIQQRLNKGQTQNACFRWWFQGFKVCDFGVCSFRNGSFRYLVLKKGEVGLCEIQFWMMRAKITPCGFPTFFGGMQRSVSQSPCTWLIRFGPWLHGQFSKVLH